MLEDSKEYYGLAPNKEVGIKYHGRNIVCDEVKKEGGKVKELVCRLDNSEGRPKPKTYISWVPADGIRCEVRVYNHLFTVPEPTDLWEDEVNPKSEIRGVRTGFRKNKLLSGYVRTVFYLQPMNQTFIA